MTRAPRIALLPLYLELYDRALPSLRDSLEPFRRRVSAALGQAGTEVVELPICRLRGECEHAVAQASAAEVDLLVTLHLAYSPSLESADALATSDLPLLLLDTTPDSSFSQEADPALLFANHGIHGVQDLANLLLRRGKPFRIVAGHLSDPRPMRRALDIARAATAARRFRRMRAVRVGAAFVGMGDFQVEESVLERLGVHVEEIGVDALAPTAAAVSEDAIAAEMARDHERFDVQAPVEVHRRSVKLGLGVSAYLAQCGATAWSMNFNVFDRTDGPVDTVPFLAASKLMAEGMGYAGEGDVLTAALVGALQTAFGGTTFTEMFCPDWQGGTVYLSHMGEANPEVAAARPLLYEKEYRYSLTHPPAALAFAPAPGPATLVNLAPGPEGSFRLICAPVTVQEDVARAEFANSLRGWVRPQVPLTDFLESYSRLGGTHHSALMLGQRTEALGAFAEFLGVEYSCIE
jgi:L-arabinose isomerase